MPDIPTGFDKSSCSEIPDPCTLMGHIEYRERIQFTVRSLVSDLELFTSSGALLHCCSVRPSQKHSPPTQSKLPKVLELCFFKLKNQYIEITT